MLDTQQLDYKEAAKILSEELINLGITASIRGGYLVADTYPKDERWEHYRFNIEFRLGNSVVSFDWRQGTGISTTNSAGKRIPKRPQPAEVLANVCRDYCDAAETPYLEWASNFGYSNDSIKSRKIYDTCIEEGEKLRHLGLSRSTINHLTELARCL